MKTENSLGEITFQNLIQLRNILEEAWNRGKLEQSIESFEKEKESYRNIAKQLGINLRDKKIDNPMTFQEWFLELVKKIETV